MILEEEFNDIRPFNDSEYPYAIEKLISSDKFQELEPYLSVGAEGKDIKSVLKSIKTIDEFQEIIIYPFVKKIINDTTDGLTSSGVEGIKGKGHLYIANHRDIVLDSAFLQKTLQDSKISTTEITVGDNLMANPLFNILGKLNKVFTLRRGGGRIEMYKNAVLHSKYINQLIRKRNESLWIAQRDGRTKDGDDKTQQGLVKMLLGNRRDIIPALQELAIVPMSISYEFEPCLLSKVRETYIKSLGDEYIKDENEDMRSSTKSIFANKGRVHIAFGTRLNQSLADIAERGLSDKEIINTFVEEIDNQIYTNFKLWPNNYIAWDIINNEQRFEKEYSESNKIKFEQYLSNTIGEIEGDKNTLRDIALRVFSNPVKNQFGFEK